MTDVRTLLHHGAGEPSDSVDLRLVAVRAGRLRLWRRALAWVAALGAVVAVGIPVERALVPADHGRVGVVTVNPPRPGDQQPPPPALEHPTAASVGSEVSAAGAAPLVHAQRLPTGGRTASQPASPSAPPAPLGPPTTAAASYPSAPACSLDSVGLAPGQTRRCQFTATTTGGWLFDDSAGGAGFDIPQGTLTVTHAGIAKTYANQHDGTDCADAIISAGDQVQLALTAPTTDVTVTYRTGAGQGWDCSTPTTSGAPT